MRSRETYTDYMALITDIIETDASYSKGTIEKLVWVDAMMEE